MNGIIFSRPVADSVRRDRCHWQAFSQATRGRAFRVYASAISASWVG